MNMQQQHQQVQLSGNLSNPCMFINCNGQCMDACSIYNTILAEEHIEDGILKEP